MKDIIAPQPPNPLWKLIWEKILKKKPLPPNPQNPLPRLIKVLLDRGKK